MIFSEAKEIEALVSGKVTMVNFRHFVATKARNLGLTGFAENAGFNVRVVAQGKEENLEKLISQMHKGPFLARVRDVSVKWREPSEKFNGFEIIY